ncbi:hypothetical protein QNN88_19475 [Citrobacter sp. ANG330]|uniref:hypothetical protein n=1 Tax=Citrobacter sp. ANG330 TaxID=3048142 RepID=UPI0039C147FB|nr:hypothetical protein [Citrobacter amalonaticus]
MNKHEFLRKMNFPVEWEIYGMYPDELYSLQLKNYHEGDEDGSEHDRNGAFHWWLKREPNKNELALLFKLTYLDSDQIMANDVRSYIRKAKNYECNLE